VTAEEATILARVQIEKLVGTHGHELYNLVERARDGLMTQFAKAKLDPTRFSDSVRLAHMNKLLDRFNEILYGRQGSAGISQSMQNAVRKMWRGSFKSAVKLAKAELEGQVSVSSFPSIQLETAAFVSIHEPRLIGLINEFNRDLYDAVNRKIQEGVILGKHPDVIAKDLVNEGLPRGRFNVAQARARLIARTEVPRAFNAGKVTSYKSVGVTHVKVVGGTSICEECAVYHEQVFRLEDAPVFPLHPNCTHTYVPIDRNGVGIGFKEAA
jgi:SPP1 gp7 family putative phage head morphogenesis protein